MCDQHHLLYFGSNTQYRYRNLLKEFLLLEDRGNSTTYADNSKKLSTNSYEIF